MTVTIPFRLLSSQSRSRQAAKADADETPRACGVDRNKVPVQLKRVVNWAAAAGHTAIIKAMLADPRLTIATIDLKDADGDSATAMAETRKHKEVVKLIHAKQDAN